jgi:hypothetical protein
MPSGNELHIWGSRSVWMGDCNVFETLPNFPIMTWWGNIDVMAFISVLELSEFLFGNFLGSIYIYIYICMYSWFVPGDSSVSVVVELMAGWLENRDLTLSRVRDFSHLLNVQTGTEAHPVSCGYHGSSLAYGKPARAWRALLTSI